MKKLVIKCTAICMLIITLGFCGCSNPLDSLKDIKVIKGISDDELFVIDNESCTVSEAKLFIVSQKNIYENAYGNEIWESKLGGMTFSSYVKGDIKSFLTHFKLIKLMADDYGTELSAEDIRTAKEAAKKLYSELSESELNYIKCSEDDVFELFKEFRKIDLFLRDFTSDIEIEISEDDARVIIIQDIFIATTKTDESGNNVALGQDEKNEAFDKAQRVYSLAESGGDFGTLAAAYSDSDQFEVKLERGVMGEEFDNIAYSLEAGQLGRLIETEYGYHIIKCIDSYNEELTDIHKEEIQSEYKSEYFEKSYSEFVEKVNAVFNDNVWDSIFLNVKLELGGSDFFSVYYSYFND